MPIGSLSEVYRRYESPLIVNPLRNYWSLMFTIEPASGFISCGKTPTILDVPKVLGVSAESLQVNHENRWRPLLYRDPSRTLADFTAVHGLQLITQSAPTIGISPPTKWRTREELEAWVFEGLPLGRAISSSVAGILRRRAFDPVEHSALIERHLSAASILLPVFRKALDCGNHDVIVTTNDRVFPSALSLLVAKEAGVEREVVYWGSGPDRLAAYGSSLFSQTVWQTLWMQAAFETDREVSRQSALVDLFAGTGESGTGQFRDRMGAAGLTRGSRPRISFFPSTPWEYSAVSGPESSQWKTQIDAAASLLRLVEARGWELVIRHHPPGADGMDRSEPEAWDQLRGSSSLVEVSAKDPVNSYKLAESSDLVACWGSSFGLEMLSRGVPVVALSTPLWASADWDCIRNSEAGVAEALDEPPQIPSTRDLSASVRLLEDRGDAFRFIEEPGMYARVDGRRILTMRKGATFVKRTRDTLFNWSADFTQLRK